MTIKNIIFDFGEVLVDWNPKYLYRSLFPNDQSIERFFADINFFEMNYKMDGGLSFAEFVSGLTAQHPQYKEPIAAYESRWSETLGEANHPVVEVLKHFKTSPNYRVFGLTNWAAETFPLGQKKFEFLTWFEDIVVSGIEKMTKPDPRIYQLLLSRNNLSAQDCLFIDDRPENVESARKLGIHGIVYKSPQQLIDDLKSINLLK